RMNCFPRERIIWRPARDQLKRQQAAFERLDKTPMNLTLAQPAIPKENVLLITGVHDIAVPAETIEELWRAWKQPEIWRLSEGLVSCLRNAPILTNRVLHWLSSRSVCKMNRALFL